MTKIDTINAMEAFEIQKTVDEDGTEHAHVIMKWDEESKSVVPPKEESKKKTKNIS